MQQAARLLQQAARLRKLLDLSIKLRSSVLIALSLFTVCADRCLAEAAKEPSPERQKINEANVLKRDNLKVKGVHHTVQIPVNFPLPIYSTNVLSTNFSNSIKGTPVAAATIVTKDSAKIAFDWYKAQCSASGWQVRTPKQSAMSESEKKGQLFILNALKGEQQSTVMCAQSNKHPNTVINISWMKHK